MGTRNSSLKRNIVNVLFANFWVSAISFAGSFIFPKILSIESYAQYHLFTLYVSYIAALHLGFPSGMVINYAGKNIETIEKRQLKSEILITLYILAFFSGLAAVLAVLLKNKMVMYIALVILPFCSVSCYRTLLQAWNQFSLYSRLSVIISVAIPIIALAIYLVTGNLNGDQYILAYLFVYFSAFAFTCYSCSKYVKGVKANPLFTRKNWDTEKTGIAMLAGNYINTLFMSADKQFVNIFFSTTEFAFYSFGMSLQSLMTIFITSIAQPLFPAMAQGNWKDNDYKKAKEVLFVFGSFSGCAYFAGAIIIKLFIQKYIESLEVIGIYFMVFPAMAVVNCIYVNLYKITGKIRLYIQTLIGLLILAVALNLFMVKAYEHYTGVAIATVVVYYCWLFVGTKQFDFIKISIKDIAYLCLYTSIYIICIREINNDYLGITLYCLSMTILAVAFYGKNLGAYVKMYKLRGRK